MYHHAISWLLFFSSFLCLSYTSLFLPAHTHTEEEMYVRTQAMRSLNFSLGKSELSRLRKYIFNTPATELMSWLFSSSVSGSFPKKTGAVMGICNYTHWRLRRDAVEKQICVFEEIKLTAVWANFLFEWTIPQRLNRCWPCIPSVLDS